jgi:hypothetical protein
MKPILMSKENPNGYKLEQLLEQLAQELMIKNENIAHDNGEVSQFVRGNNLEIIRNLTRSKQLQDQSYKMLEKLGTDQGPKGKARL